MNIRYKNVYPTPEEYNELRNSVGWNTFDMDSTKKAILATNYFILAFNENEIIGMARVTGDGCICFYISDVIVKPNYQLKGIGRRMLEHILSYISDNAAENAHIGLNAAMGKEAFYTKFGFFVRPTQKYGPGMSRIWKKNTY